LQPTPDNMLITAPSIPDALLQQVGERIERRMGLHFPPARFTDLERGLVQAAREAGEGDPRNYIESLLNRDLHLADLETLASSLTIGETHFFRDPRAFEFLETTLLPELIAAKRGGSQRLRIWSAGCATGEEPYSLAMLLHRLIPDIQDWNITILGTDINPKVLARAAAGSYSEWAFRDTPEWVKSKYFTPHASNRYEIQPWLKRMVAFNRLNLADDDYPSLLTNTNAMDLIICRNVLLYFSTARIPEVVRRFHQALIDGGQFILGSVEAAQMNFPEFTPLPTPGMALFQKLSGTRSAERGTRNTEAAPKISAAIPEIHISKTTAARPSVPRSPLRVPPSPAETPPALFAAGRYQEARELLLAEVDRVRASTASFAPPNLESATLLAQCHANLGELTEALVWCERALGIAKTDLATHFLHASILRELGRDEEALLALRNVLFLEPDHVFAHFTSANLHRRCGRKSAAAKHFANARQLLAGRDEREELPHSGGLTIGQLSSILVATAGAEENTTVFKHE